MKTCFYIYILLLFSVNTRSQTVYESRILPVEKSGYYNVELNNEMIAGSNTQDLSDLKIRDNENSEVPFFIRSVNPVTETSEFTGYNLIQNTTKGRLNIIIIENSSTENINRFFILSRNSDVRKYTTVRGSNNLKNFYIVKQRNPVSELRYNNSDNTEMLVIDIPQGNYRYYEITIDNNQKSPLEILKVGKIENSNVYGQFSAINLGRFSKKDSSDRKTYIRFSELADTYRINKLHIGIKNNTLYKRKAFLTDSVTGSFKSFELSSHSDNTFFIDDTRISKHSIITIENNNNPPLSVDSIYAFGLKRYICVFLEKDKKYFLQSGIKDSIQPQYDITYFQKEIPVDLPIVTTDSLRQIKLFIDDKISDKKQPSFIEKPLFLWGVIVIIGLFLTFICITTLKQIKKKD